MATIKCMPDDFGPNLVRNDINRAVLLVMQREDLKEIGVTQVGSLALLLKGIENLCREKKSEAVFMDHNAYCFGKILDTLRLRAMCRSEGTMPPVYIQESHRERFKKIADYLFPGDSTSFILQKMEIYSTILSTHQSSQSGSWLSEDGVSKDLELLYRGSRDGRQASDFHAKCDNKGATIAVIRSTGGFIFGGFDNIPWTSSSDLNEGWRDRNRTFLFSLKSPSNEVGPTKICAKKYERCCRSSYSLSFGNGHELCIKSDANNNSRT